jgi:CheY-like chemotaxis protein
VSPGNVELRWVKDGQEALDYLLHTGKYRSHEASPRPDLILLDLIMPRKDGLQALEEIKGHPYLQQIPVAVLTSSVREEHKSSGFELGADFFIAKPYSLEEMIAIMIFLRARHFTPQSRHLNETTGIPSSGCYLFLSL